jgi:hypothetical protein
MEIGMVNYKYDWGDYLIIIMVTILVMLSIYITARQYKLDRDIRMLKRIPEKSVPIPEKKRMIPKPKKEDELKYYARIRQEQTIPVLPFG